MWLILASLLSHSFATGLLTFMKLNWANHILAFRPLYLLAVTSTWTTPTRSLYVSLFIVIPVSAQMTLHQRDLFRPTHLKKPWYLQSLYITSLCFIHCTHHYRKLYLSMSPLSFSFFVFLPFLGPFPWHIEVPRLGGLSTAVAAGLHHSDSNVGSEPRLQPTSQLMATPDP